MSMNAKGISLAIVAAMALVIWYLPGDDTAEGRGAESPVSRVGPDRGIVAPVQQELSPTPLSAMEPRTVPLAHVPPALDSLEFRGTVCDPDGEPVEGALVQIRVRAPSSTDARSLGESQSDAFGRFAVAVPRTQDFPGMLICRATVWGLSSSVSPVVPETDIQITVRWTATLFGLARDGITGTPLSGVAVSAGSHQTVTDLNGEYSLGPFTVGHEQTIVATRSGFVELVVKSALTQRGPRRQDLALDQGVVLDCVVHDADSGLPITGAEVRTESRRLPIASSDATGHIEIRASAGRTLRRVFTAQGYCQLHWTCELDALDSETIQIPLVRRAWIEGDVRDQAGTPLPVAYAYAACSEHHFGRHSFASNLPGRVLIKVPRSELDGGQDGRFSLPVVPCASPYKLHVQVQDYPAEKLELTLETPGQHYPVELALVRGSTVRGEVRMNGLPLVDSGSQVCWRYSETLPGGCVTIGPDGHYIATGVRPGRVEFYLRDGMSTRDVTSVWVQVPDGGEVEQDLTWSVPMGTITGRVTSIHNKPAADVVVSASNHEQAGYRYFHAVTAEDGSYSIAVESRWTYKVTASRQEISRHREAVESGDTGIDFELPEMGKLAFRLVEARTGEPIVKYLGFRSLRWREQGTRAFRWKRPPGGVHEVQVISLPVGVVDVMIDCEEAGYLPAVVEGIRVATEPAEPVVFELVRGVGARFHFLVQEGDGTPWADHLLFVLEEAQLPGVAGPFPEQGGESNYRVNGVNIWVDDPRIIDQGIYPDANGRAALKRTARGRYSIVAIPDDLLFEPRWFEVPIDADQRIEIFARHR